MITVHAPSLSSVKIIKLKIHIRTHTQNGISCRASCFTAKRLSQRNLKNNLKKKLMDRTTVRDRCSGYFEI